MSRAYKKGKPSRDARLFIIVAEGEREDEYFTYFNEINSRIRISIVPREAGKSAPNFFLERVDNFKKSGELSIEDRDQLWFICDVDKWVRAQIEELHQHCQSEENWYLAISNPCFEVWLHYHSDDMIQSGQSCSDLKRTLPTKKAGQFNVTNYCTLLEEAIRNAEQADKNSRHHFPDEMETKVYKLGKNMLELLGNNWKP